MSASAASQTPGEAPKPAVVQTPGADPKPGSVLAPAYVPETSDAPAEPAASAKPSPAQATVPAKAISVAPEAVPTPTRPQSAIAFKLWLEDLRAEAAMLGVSSATFDLAFKGVTPDLRLPDLVKPGEKPQPGKGQAEFSKTPARYLNKSYLLKLANQGKALHAKHTATLADVETKFGVHRSVVLAIWGRESAFGNYRLPHYAIRALVTQAYLGRRKAMFRKELLYALKMLEDKFATLKDMRSSWAGALGLTQLMPSEYYTIAQDMDGDGRKDIWRSVPDALASAAYQLKLKGWVAGPSWGYEIKLGPGADCSLEGPKQTKSLGAWAGLGLMRTQGRTFAPELMAVPAYLMMPAGGNGPGFLVTENFQAIKRYNPSDLYALFVGHLADRIVGGGDFARAWTPIKQLPRAEVAEIQALLKAQGYDVGAVDGLIGSKTRSQLGAYQKAHKLRVDCWPSTGVLQKMRTIASR